MKSLRISASIAMLAAGMFALQAPAADTTQPTAGQAASTTQPNDTREIDAIRHIQIAPDASSVVEAYAHARSVAPDSIAVSQAYIARLVSLGMPEMAESQARDLTTRAPDDGLAWAVVAYADSRHDNMRSALEEIATAAKKLPDDGFVQRTAAQLLAYHDKRVSEVSYPDTLENSLADMRNALTGKPEFDSTYRLSKQAYAAAPTTGPVTIGRYTYTPPDTTYDNGGPRVTYDDSYNGYSGYSSPIYTNPYLYVAPSYGYFYYPYYHSYYYHRGFDDHFHGHFDHSDFHNDFHNDHNDFHNHFIRPGFGHTSFDGNHDFGSRDSGMIDRGQRYVGGGVSGGRMGSAGSAGGGSSGARGMGGGGGGHR